MSNSFALAGVTAVLMDRLNDGILNHNITASSGTIKVSAKPPDKVVNGETTEDPQLNIFLYQVTPNIGWRNAELPAYNRAGEQVSNPPLALDLHYLISAFGEADAETDILLGGVVSLLHAMPILRRSDILESLNNGGLPAHLTNLANCGLADQMEQIKITPEHLNTEEISKLWSAFQSNFRPSVAYIVTVVLIQNNDPVRSPLPVLTRGLNDRGAEVQADLIPPVPTITNIEYAEQQTSARQGDTIVLHGHHLDGTNIRVILSNPLLPAPLEIIPEPGITDEQMSIVLSIDPADWRAGVYTLAINLQRPGDSYQRYTNEMPFILAPTITGHTVSGSSPNFNVQLQIEPQVWPDQTVSLILGQHEVPAQEFTSKTDTLDFSFHDLADGNYPARLRVSGIESWLINKVANPPEFYSSQIFTVGTP